MVDMCVLHKEGFAGWVDRKDVYGIYFKERERERERTKSTPLAILFPMQATSH